MTEAGRAIFLSYASQDAEAALRLCNALRNAGVEVWFDRSELRGGDAWDASIRRQIKTCALFVPIISRHTHARDEGYFRLEWKLAVDRSHLMVADRPFLLPVVVDDISDQDDKVPDRFREVQWTRLPGGQNAEAFVERVRGLVSPETAAPGATSTPSRSVATVSAKAGFTRSMTSASRSLAPWFLGGLLVLASGYFLADKFLAPRPSVPAGNIPAPAAALKEVSDKSIAVLPFLDMSEKKDQEYFSDGLSEELIDQLARAPDLKVIARTSSFQFKGKSDDTNAIGQRLGVANLLEGSVRKSGNTLRIAVQLVRADTGYHLWSATYDRKADDIFKVQDEIAAAVLQALKATLLEDSASRTTGTQNIEAYAFYLQGHAIYQRAKSQSDYDAAIDFFHRALKTDPNYARAWAALSSAITVAADFEFLPLNSAKQDGRQAAERALVLDPGLADAHVAMARYVITMELDVGGGEAQIRRALELEPNHSGALAWAGKLASWRGQFDQATALIQRSITSDPLDPNRYDDLAANYYYAGKYVDALNAYHKALAFREDIKKHSFLGTIMLARGDPSSALKEIDFEPNEQVRLACMCRALALDATGRTAEADAWLADMIKNHADDGPSAIGYFYASRGNLDEAFRWFDRAYRERDSGILDIKIDPFIRNVRGDPRFDALLKKLGLVEQAKAD